MERYAWKATVLPGKLEEYIRRHNEIWPEMKDVLHQAGIRNYTIWNVGNELFGYYECDSVAEAPQVRCRVSTSRRISKRRCSSKPASVGQVSRPRSNQWMAVASSPMRRAL